MSDKVLHLFRRQLNELMKSGPAVLIDTRDPGRFSEGHIRGAVKHTRGVHLPGHFIIGRSGSAPRRIR